MILQSHRSSLILKKFTGAAVLLMAFMGCRPNKPHGTLLHTMQVGKVPVGYGKAFSIAVDPKQRLIVLSFDSAIERFKTTIVSFPSLVKAETILPVKNAVPQGYVACSVNVETNSRVYLLCGLDRLKIADAEFNHCLVSDAKLVFREVPEMQGFRIGAMHTTFNTRSLAIVATRLQGGAVLYAIATDSTNTLEKSDTIEGGQFAVAQQSGVLRVGVVRTSSENDSQVRFYDVRVGDQLRIVPNEWPVLHVPTFLQKIAFANDDARVTVIGIGAFAVYECILTDGQWQIIPIAQEGSRIAAEAGVCARRGSACVLYQPFGGMPRMLVRDRISKQWINHTITEIFPKYVYQVAMVFDDTNGLYTLTSEGNSKDVFIQDLVLRKWVLEDRVPGGVSRQSTNELTNTATNPLTNAVPEK